MSHMGMYIQGLMSPETSLQPMADQGQVAKSQAPSPLVSLTYVSGLAPRALQRRPSLVYSFRQHA